MLSVSVNFNIYFNKINFLALTDYTLLFMNIIITIYHCSHVVWNVLNMRVLRVCMHSCVRACMCVCVHGLGACEGVALCV